jgi:hypothetical protein
VDWLPTCRNTGSPSATVGVFAAAALIRGCDDWAVIAENAVLRDDDPGIGELHTQGWRIVARSWAAQLIAVDVNAERLTALVEAMPNDCGA